MTDWHNGNKEKFQISMDESRRKRQGVEGFFMGALGVINDDFNYKKVSGKTVALIEHQADGKIIEAPAVNNDLFQENVRLVAKDGKLFYLPSAEENNVMI